MNFKTPECSCVFQDGGTLPVGILAEDEFDIFIPLMCRRLPMFHEKDVDYDGINTYRSDQFIAIIQPNYLSKGFM